jgi:hypothetical protein
MPAVDLRRHSLRNTQLRAACTKVSQEVVHIAPRAMLGQLERRQAADRPLIRGFHIRAGLDQYSRGTDLILLHLGTIRSVPVHCPEQRCGAELRTLYLHLGTVRDQELDGRRRAGPGRPVQRTRSEYRGGLPGPRRLRRALSQRSPRPAKPPRSAANHSTMCTALPEKRTTRLQEQDHRHRCKAARYRADHWA